MTSWDELWHRMLRRPHRLNVASYAGVGQPVVLLHGIASDGSVWEPVISQLDGSKWQVIVPDLLGFGGSPKPEWSDYDVDSHAKAVIATIKKIRIKKPVVLVGHSMGCLVASRIAALRPAMVKKLVLYEPALFVDEAEFKRHARRRDRYFRLYEYLVAHPHIVLARSQTLRRLAARFGGFTMTKENWVPFERSLRNTIMRQQAYRELGKVRVPTYIIHGRLDFVVTRADVKRMFKNNPHVSLFVANHIHGISRHAATYLVKLME